MTFDARKAALFVDTNLLELFAVGSVNRSRIEAFKRTRQYTIGDFELLLRVLQNRKPLYTIAHVLAEVSNLTDLPGLERRLVRETLKQTISILTEAEIASARAADEPVYPRLGLVDAAIAAVAREHRYTVLTDDLDLHLALQHNQIEVINFTHLRERVWGI